jgi:hypothetical protein
MSRTLQGLVVAALLLVGACAQESSPVARSSPEARSPDGDTASSTTTGSCVEQYSLETLKKRDYAFDGTITKIDPAADAEDETAQADRVTFDVNVSYKGVAGENAVRRAYGFTAVTSAGGAPHEVGQRLLVAGDDDFVWECGFTQPYDSKVAADWARTFEP